LPVLAFLCHKALLDPIAILMPVYAQTRKEDAST